MMQAEPAPDRKKRWILSIGQQDPRPLVAQSASSSDNSIARLHAAMVFNPSC
jgi:hypothetical protein